MEYNKTQFSKASDKKVLHKVRKHWVVLSTALLMVLGGGAALTGGTTSANADANANSNNDTNTSSTNALKSRLNASLTKGYQSNQTNTPKSVNVNQVSSKTLTNQASALHNRILANATNTSQNRQSTTNGRQVSQNNNNEGAVLNNRIKASVNAPKISANYNAPRVGGQNTYSTKAPVTVAYLNQDHTIQNKSDGSGHLTPNITSADVTISDALNSHSSNNMKYNDITSSNPDYKLVNNPVYSDTITSDDGIYGYKWNKPSNAKSDNNFNVPVDSSVNWDSKNNRPVILLESNQALESGQNDNDIVVNYVNQRGQTLSDSGTKWGNSTDPSDTISNLSGKEGDVINVTNSDASQNGGIKGIYIPAKYRKSYSLTQRDTNSPTKVLYSVKNHRQYITIPVYGKPFTSNNDNNYNKLTANVYIKNQSNKYLESNGSTTSTKTPYKSISDYLSGTIGGSTTVTPSDFKNDLPGGAQGYSNDPSNQDQTIQFNSHLDGNGNADGYMSISPSTVNFTYDVNANSQYSKKANIFIVNYIDQNGHEIGKHSVTNVINPKNRYGQTINVLSDSSDGLKGPENYNYSNSDKGSYTLDPHQSPYYTINSDGGNLYYYFTGNDKYTNNKNSDYLNYPLTIKIQKKYWKNSDNHTQYVPDPNKGTNGIQSDTEKPSDISDLVGNSKVLNAATFAPSVNNARVQPVNSLSGVNGSVLTQDSITFDPNGYLDVKDLNSNADAVNYDKNSHTLTFDYNIYENPSSIDQHHIYVHYVTPSDSTNDISTIYNSDGKASDNKDTTVSDAGYAGEAFNNNAVEESDNNTKNGNSDKGGNVPSGYQFMKVLGDNPKYNTSDDHTMNNSFHGWNGSPNGQHISQFSDNDQNEVIQVVPKVKGVTVNYVAQNGKTIKSVAVPGFYGAAGTKKGNSRYGETVNLSNGTIVNDGENKPSTSRNYDPTKDITNELTVPNGYHIKSDGVTNSDNMETTSYTFNQNGDGNKTNTYNVLIIGNNEQDQAIDTAKIHIHEEDPTGHQVLNSYTINDSINGRIGDRYSISPDQFTPSGYMPNPVASAQVQSGIIQKSGLSNSNINFYYKQNNQAATQNLGNIYVTYYYKGKQIYMNTISPIINGTNGYNDYANENVNVTTRGNDGYNLPNGYDLVPGQNTVSTFRMNHQPSNLSLNVYNPNDQSRIYGNLTVIQNLYHGSVTPGNFIKTVYKQVPESDVKGSTKSINQSNYPVNGFSDSPSSGATQNIKFDSDGITPSNVTFNYVATTSNNHGTTPTKPSDQGPTGPVTPSQAEPIFVQYYDQSQAIGNDERVDGYMDQKFSDITTQAPVPSNYHLAPNQQLSYTIGDQERQVDLQVEKDTSNEDTLTLHLYEEAPNGHTLNNNRPVANRTVKIGKGSSSDISPFSYNPDPMNYKFDKSDRHGTDLTVSDKDGDIYLDGQEIENAGNPVTNASDNFYYKAFGSNSDVNLEPINATYINQQGTQVGYKIFGTSGAYAGEQINVAASNDIPHGYHADNSTQNVTYGDVTQNVIVPVTGDPQTNGLDVEYTLFKNDGSTPSTVTKSINPYNITGNVGNDYPLTASDVLTHIPNNTNYQSDSKDPLDKEKYIHINNHSLTPNRVHFDFYEKSNANNIAGNLFINFITRDGTSVGNATISGKTIGTHIPDIASDSTDNVRVPSGYEVDPTLYPHNRGLGYTFKDKQDHNVSVIVYSKAPVNATLKVHIIKIDSNGHHSESDTTDPIKAGVKDVVKVNPSQFTPSGYYADPRDGEATVTVLGNSDLNPSEVTFVYDQNTISDASDMVVRYFNQDGHKVGQGTISGKDNFGKPVDVTKHVAIPNGYTLSKTGPNSNPDQRTNYVFNGTQHVINLNVQGKRYTKSLTIHINREGSTGYDVDDNDFTENVGSDEPIAPNSVVNGKSLTPQGYHPTASDNVQNILMKSDGTLNPSHITFNYVMDNQQAKPLTLIYLNQDGNQVGYTDHINGSLDRVVNVTDPNDNGEPIPQGYTLAGGETTTNGHSANSDVIGNDQDVKYRLTNYPQTVYLHVQGDTPAPNSGIHRSLLIYRIMHNANGSMKEDHITYDLPDNDSAIGDHTLINPSESGIEPSGYHTSSSDQSQLATVNNNGSVTPNQLTFNYYAGDQAHAGIIWVHYIDQDSHRQIGGTHEFTSAIGNQLTSNDIKNKDAVPAGYTEVSGQPSVYTYTNAPQNVNINVEGNQVTNQPFTIYVVKRDQNGNFIGATPRTFKYTGHVGDAVTISPYDSIDSSNNLTGNSGTALTPSGYHADASDQDVTVHVDQNGHFVPQNNVTYAYTQNSVAQSIGTITIHYGTDSNPNDTNPASSGTWTDVDSVTDHGIIADPNQGISGSTFDLNPYKDDVPDELNDSYSIDKVISGGDVHGYVANNQSNNQNVYIRLKKVN